MADPVFVDGVTPINAANMNKLQTRDEKGAINGYAPLGPDGKVPGAQLPPPVASGAALTYRGDWVAGTYVDGDVVVLGGIAYLCVGGPTIVAPDSNLWDDLTAPATSTPWVPMWSLAPAGGVLTGEVKQYGGAVVPPGYLWCDGASYLRSVYGALFSVIGTQFGSVDGTHFNVPDTRSRGVVGLGTHADTDALGKSDGIAEGGRSPRHRHSVDLSDPGHNHPLHVGSIGGSVGDAGGRNNEGNYTGMDPVGTGISVTVGPAGYPTDMPAYIVLNYMIKT